MCGRFLPDARPLRGSSLVLLFLGILSAGCTVNVTPPAPTAATSKPFDDKCGSVEGVAAKVAPSVVTLETEYATGSGFMDSTGSGFIWSSDGLILTNAHVVADGSGHAIGGKLTFSGGGTTPFSVVKSSPRGDVAVVRATDISGHPPATMGSSAELRVGAQVVAFGAPTGLSDSVTNGIISALNRQVPIDPSEVSDAIQTNAAISPGSSGGPLVDMHCKVIGVNFAVREGANGIGFAIPIDSVLRTACGLIGSSSPCTPSVAGLPTRTAGPVATAPTQNPPSDADIWGFVDSHARCDPSVGPAVAIARTAKSKVVICSVSSGAYVYRGERLHDNAHIELRDVVPTADGFDIANHSDGTHYRLRPSELAIDNPSNNESYTEATIEFWTKS